MKKLFLFLLMGATLDSYSQSGPQTYYRNLQGQTFSKSQFDSVRKAGATFPIESLKRLISGDSIIIVFNINKDLKVPETITNFTKSNSGKLLPAFYLTDVNGKKFTSADLKGKVVHINFWSVTCGPCIAEMPDMNKMKDKYKNNKDVVLIAIAPESKERVSQFLKQHTFSYHILVNGEAYFKQLNLDFYPGNFFIDKTGIIKKVATGTPTINGTISVYNNYTGIIEQLLKQ
jgi:cytochrome c biogenesis protein CcmG/thiol:disulfide interchange protein DsbE